MKPTFVSSEPLLLPKQNKPLGYRLFVDDMRHPYLKERGLSPETIDAFDLGYCETGPLKGHIAIPVYDAQERLVGYAGRYPGEPPPKRDKYKFVSESYFGHELFNLHRVLREHNPDPIVLVTGFFDVMHLWQLGWRNAVALMSWELKMYQLAQLLYHFPAHRFIALFDETHYGRAARASLMLTLPARAFVRIVHFREGGRLVESLTKDELEELP